MNIWEEFRTILDRMEYSLNRYISFIFEKSLEPSFGLIIGAIRPSLSSKVEYELKLQGMS